MCYLKKDFTTLTKEERANAFHLWLEENEKVLLKKAVNMIIAKYEEIVSTVERETGQSFNGFVKFEFFRNKDTTLTFAHEVKIFFRKGCNEKEMKIALREANKILKSFVDIEAFDKWAKENWSKDVKFRHRVNDKIFHGNLDYGQSVNNHFFGS